MRFQRVVAETVAVTAGAVVVAGCSSSPEPTPLPEPTLSSATSPSPSPSPSITPPTLPPEAEGTSSQAATAFARYYIDLINFAAATGETSRARSVSQESCDSCEAILGKIERIYAAGGHLEGDGWKVRNLKYQPSQPTRRPIVSVGIQITRQVMIEEAGASPTQFPGGRNQLDLRLAYDSSGWSVSDFERLS